MPAIRLRWDRDGVGDDHIHAAAAADGGHRMTVVGIGQAEPTFQWFRASHERVVESGPRLGEESPGPGGGFIGSRFAPEMSVPAETLGV